MGLIGIYGPFRVGFQTSLNLDTNQEISI
ncbi:MAG: DUF3769 domain-containing protein [Moorea sp. SIO1F2]|nr:DUF3769 domain-containing protein [Moorena sp. SIO1F2]